MAKAELDIEELIKSTFEKHFGVTLDRLRELAEADKDGLCVVLPCKVGDTIWVAASAFNSKSVVRGIDERVIDEIKHNKLNKNTLISKEPYELHFYPSEIGKTVFLTRPEAEAAMEKEQEHD